MKVLLVTGSSRGIGAEICRQAAAEGWKVCLNYASSADEADQVVAQIRAKGGTAIALQANVANEDEVITLFKRIDLELGPITGLVNNAGINGAGTRVDEMNITLSKQMFEVNTLGAFICAKHAIKRMAKRYGGNGGAIVNISSAASKHGGPFTYVDYAASKAAIDTFTIGLSKEQADQGIRVNCLRPGITMTEISVDYAKQHPEWLDWVLLQVPLGRPAEVSEVANSAMFLLSDKSSYTTGAILDVCGGWVSP
ncbi:SDR family oxidoreductase [Candidatus Njordibacter sp. Uisw_039]|jgi:NAD(P)-dependent dehydrogenase (short-subunit alcohol dehydrogenase family)|uniref:SDR family oxidoreductase n=1 Tax=Candidatus Njordibacter sp. Uisw_039 TaxID=3230972 RepID=UPI003D37EB9F|tara:strand:+ start:1427 stop:2185 length:759 start_codon:yes stop_codon:yes gene_type:complete